MRYEPPFSEELVAYCPKLYDFESHVLRLLRLEGVKLSELHEAVQRPRLHSPLRLDPLEALEELFLVSFHGFSGALRIQDAGFTAMYHDFLRDVVRGNLGEEMLIFEHCPNLRIHLAGEKSLTTPHTDKDHQHSEAELLGSKGSFRGQSRAFPMDFCMCAAP